MGDRPFAAAMHAAMAARASVAIAAQPRPPTEGPYELVRHTNTRARIPQCDECRKAPHGTLAADPRGMAYWRPGARAPRLYHYRMYQLWTIRNVAFKAPLSFKEPVPSTNTERLCRRQICGRCYGEPDDSDDDSDDS